jgi:MoaA/NifB/PqqE/SkfB family radical SAM enzyme
MNKSFCALPWLHIHPYPSGKVYPCCVSDLKLPVGNLKNNNLNEIIHSPEMNNIRAKMLKGEMVNECFKSCISTENTKHYTTKRKNINNFYKEIIPNLIESTNEDGSFKDKKNFKMRHLNIRFSNLCNFKCRTCSSDLSSLILQEEDSNKKFIHIENISDSVMNDVYNYLPDVDLIHFAGGETLLIDEHWEIMDKLIEIGNTDITIVCTTNLSKITYKNKSIIDYIKQFKNFQLYVSIDAIGERAEIYRDGTVWSTIENNLRTLVESGIKFNISCTVGATNIYHIPDMLEYLYSNDLVCRGETVLTSMLTQPDYLNCKLLPSEYKKEVAEKFATYNKSINQKYNANSAVDFMNGEDQSYLIPKFIEYHNKMDSRRNQNIFEVFPELKKIQDESFKSE